MSGVQIAQRVDDQPDALNSEASLTTKNYHDILERLRVIECPTTQGWLDSMLTSMHALAITWEEPLIKFPATAVPKPDVLLIDAETYAVHLSIEGMTIIGVDKRMLLSMNNVDAVAFVIGHELGHQVYRARYTISDFARATAAEELFCDRFALDIMSLAGYSPQGALDFFDHLIALGDRYKTPESLTLISVALDEHFSAHARWAQLKEDFIGVTRLMTGRGGSTDEERPCETLPSEIVNEVQSARFVSVIERALEERGFTDASLDTKTLILGEVVPLITRPHRAEEFLEVVQSLIQKHGTNLTRFEEFHDLFNQVLGIALAGDQAHKSIVSGVLKAFYRQQGTVPLVGRLRDFDRSVQYHLGSEGSCAPAPDVVADVRRVARICEGEDEFALQMYRPYVELTWGVSLDSAIAAASADPSGLKASLLYATVCHDHYFTRVIDRLPLAVLEASLEHFDGKNLRRMVEERRWWEQDISSYELFRANPTRFLENFAPGFVAPETLSTPQQYCAAHPYAKHRSGSPLREALHPTSAILVTHLERFLRENPRQGKYIIRTLFLGSSCPARLKLSLTDRAAIPKDIGFENYPTDGPLATFLLRNRGLFPGHDLAAAMIRIGIKVDLSDFEALIGAKYPRTLSQMKHMMAVPSLHPIFNPAFGYAGKLMWQYIEDVVRASPKSPKMAGQLVKVIAANDYVAGTIPIASAPKMREVLREKIFTSETRPPELFYEAISIEGLTSLITLGERASLFPSGQEKEVASAVLSEKLGHIRSESLRARYCADILTIPPTVIQLREVATSLLADHYRARFGLDSGSVTYEEQFKAKLTVDLKHMPGDIRNLLCRKVAEAVESQESLSYSLRDMASNARISPAAYHVPLKGAEVLLRAAGKTGERMESTLEFLLEPVTPDSVARYSAAIRSWEVLSHNERVELERLFARNDMHGESALQEAIWLYTLHRYISSLSVETKAAIMKQILVAPERLHRDSEATYEHAVRFSLDRIFPSTRPGNELSADSSSRWSRILVESFVLAAHPSERGYLLAAMLAAGQSSGGSSARAGAQLKRLFEHLGPAYIKLGQAIHSYPSTPRDIREDLVGLKGMAAVPPRWELFEMLSERMDPSIRSELVRVGGIRGAASFNIVATYRDPLGRRGAFSLLRPFALERALKGFDDLTRMVDIVTDRDPSLSRFKEDALDILRHAREMTTNETDMRLGFIQHTSARQRYEGKRYISHGVPFHVTTARWRSVGEGYRTMDEARGDSFDALPEHTSAQRWFKRAVAKVIVSVELESILSGGCFDYDRHERQYHIAGTTIIALDHGGESLRAPTADDRRHLASLVGRLAQRLISNEGGGDALHAALEEGIGRDDYGQRLQKGLLALSGILSYLTPADVAGVVAHCWFQGTVCQEVDLELSRIIPASAGIGHLRELPAWVRNIVLWRKSGVTRVGKTQRGQQSLSDDSSHKAI